MTVVNTVTTLAQRRARLWRTMRAVERAAKKGLWEQRFFVCEKGCGTAYCFAGWALKLSGTPPYETYGDSHLNFGLAARWLGLTSFESVSLFLGYNTLDDLRRLVREFAGPEPKRRRRAVV